MTDRMVKLHRTNGPAIRRAARRHIEVRAKSANSGSFTDRFDMIRVYWRRDGDVVNYCTANVRCEFSRRDREDFHADG